MHNITLRTRLIDMPRPKLFPYTLLVEWCAFSIGASFFAPSRGHVGRCFIKRACKYGSPYTVQLLISANIWFTGKNVLLRGKVIFFFTRRWEWNRGECYIVSCCFMHAWVLQARSIQYILQRSNCAMKCQGLPYIALVILFPETMPLIDVLVESKCVKNYR